MSSPGYFIRAQAGTGPSSYAAAHARYYYSAFTYQRPNVKLLALPNPVGGNMTLFASSLWPSASGILLKRTSTTNYIMIRWHTVTTYTLGSWHDLEIVVNNTGGGEVIRASVSNGSLFYQPALLISWLDANNVVHAQIVDPNAGAGHFDPTTGTITYNSLLSTSYQLNAGEITALGAGVAGAAGIVQVLTSNNWQHGDSVSGAVCKYTATRDDIAPASSSAVVLGDVDTPPRLRLGGDVVNPLVTISTPDGISSSVQFVDTFAQTNPVFVDFDQGTIIDSTGANRFSGVQSGSSMRNLQPGVNIVTVQADNWTNGVQHALVWWRDARK